MNRTAVVKPPSYTEAAVPHQRPAVRHIDSDAETAAAGNETEKQRESGIAEVKAEGSYQAAKNNITDGTTIRNLVAIRMPQSGVMRLTASHSRNSEGRRR